MDKSLFCDAQPVKKSKQELFTDQITMLKTLLAHGAITIAQYKKSAGDLSKKMNFPINDVDKQ